MEFFGRTRVFTFDNGVRLGVMARPGVAFQLLCGFATGSIHEGKHLGCGLSHIMEHMLFQGCDGYPGTRVSELAREWSASLNAYTSYDRTVITVGGPAAVWSEALAMVLAMARTPEIAPAALAGELEVILRECAMYADKPPSRLFERHVLDGAQAAVSGIVHKHVDSAFGLQDLPDARLDRRGIGHVHPDRNDAFGLQGLHQLHPSGRRIHAVSLGCQRLRGIIPDAAAGARNEDDFIQSVTCS